jgi:hypothetical protein
MVTILFTDVQAIKKQTSLCRHNPSVPMSTMSRDTFPSPLLARDLPPLSPINNTIVGSGMAQVDLPNLPVVETCTWTTPNQPLLTPQKHLRAVHISIAFLAATTKTKQQDYGNRSIGRNYCIGTTADGPFVAASIVPCNYIVVVDASCT